MLKVMLGIREKLTVKKLRMGKTKSDERLLTTYMNLNLFQKIDELLRRR